MKQEKYFKSKNIYKEEKATRDTVNTICSQSQMNEPQNFELVEKIVEY